MKTRSSTSAMAHYQPGGPSDPLLSAKGKRTSFSRQVRTQISSNGQEISVKFKRANCAHRHGSWPFQFTKLHIGHKAYACAFLVLLFLHRLLTGERGIEMPVLCCYRGKTGVAPPYGERGLISHHGPGSRTVGSALYGERGLKFF